MKYKNFLIKLFDLILIVGLLAGYQAVIYSREKASEIAELESQINQLEGEKNEIMEAAKASGSLGTDSSESSAASTYADGTYEGSGDGFGGKIKVSVTVKDQKITAIEITEAKGEDEAYLSMAKDIIDTIIDAQSAEVDTVSGATYSSTGIKTAVAEALKGASGE